jgi:hypothetical protein
MGNTARGTVMGKLRFARPALRAALLGWAALGLASCGHTPPGACPSGQVPLVSNTTYAVYQGGSKVQVEDTRAVKNRCVVPVGEPPAGPAGSFPTPACQGGTVAVSPGTVSASYFGVADASRQLEDMRTVGDRCILEIPPFGVDQCPPGTRPKTIQGAVYCVPAP